MTRKGMIAGVVMLLLVLVSSVQSFCSKLLHPIKFRKKTYPFVSISSQDTSDTGQVKHLPTQLTSDVMLTFVGSKRITSPTAFMSNDLYNFFAVQKNRNLLFFQNNVTEVTPITQSLVEEWDQQAMLGGATGPSTLQWIEDDRLNNQSSTEMERCQVIQIDAHLNLPGLRVLSQSIIGAKLFKSVQCLPEYQFTLLDSKLIPTGPAPLVWLFKQLTRYRNTTSSFTRVTVQHVVGSNASYNQIQFVTESRLETRVRVPLLLAKTLSIKKLELFEQQGAAAVQNMLEKELEPALMTFFREYCAFVPLVPSQPVLLVD